jgi:hypothetical protein
MSLGGNVYCIESPLGGPDAKRRRLSLDRLSASASGAKYGSLKHLGEQEKKQLAKLKGEDVEMYVPRTSSSPRS